MADLEIAWTVPALTDVTEALDFMAGFDPFHGYAARLSIFGHLIRY